MSETKLTMAQRWKQGPPTEQEILGLPPRVELVDAARALRWGREASQAAVHSGTFPIRVIKVGRFYYCNKTDLFAELGMSATAQRQDGAA